MTKWNFSDHEAKVLADAKAALEEHGNETDKLLFERLGRHVVSSLETEYQTANGISHKRRRLDVVSDGAVAEELALILSWRVGGWTQNFWSGAAHAAEKEKKKSPATS